MLAVSPAWPQVLPRRRCAKHAPCPNLGNLASCPTHARSSVCPSHAPSRNRDGQRQQQGLRPNAYPHATRARSPAFPTQSVYPVAPSRASRYPERRCGATAYRCDCQHAPRMHRATLGFYSLVSRNRLSWRPAGRHLERHEVILTAPCRNVELPCPVSHGTRLHHHRKRRCRRNHHSQGKADDN